MIAKGFLKLSHLHMLIKLESITSQKLGCRDFWRIANSVLLNGPEVLSSASDKAKLFAENFSTNSHLDDSSISLLALHVLPDICNSQEG